MSQENFRSKGEFFLFEARNLSVFLALVSSLKKIKPKKDSTFLVIGPKEIFSFLHLIPFDTVYYHNRVFPALDSYFYLMPWNTYIANSFLKRTLKIHSDFTKAHFFTSFPRGIWYTICKKVFLNKFPSGQISIVDDGSINLSKDFYFEEKSFKNFSRKLLYFLLLGIEGFKNANAINIDDFHNYYTCYKETLEKRFGFVNLVDISYSLHSLYKNLSNNLLKDCNSNVFLLLTHHAVESRRLSQKKYQKLLSQLLKIIKENNYDTILISKHHSESTVNDEFYRHHELVDKYSEIPAEILMVSEKVTGCATPFNTSIIQLSSMKINPNLDLYIGYKIPSSPLIGQRMSETSKALNSWKTKYLIIE